jgi:hypothetical protein
MTAAPELTCVRCGVSLADREAHTCPVGCTYCDPCTAALEKVCMNCGGELTPLRSGAERVLP